jgi:hypothetical protein
MGELDNVSWFLVGAIMTGLLALAVFLAWLLLPLFQSLL